MLVPSNPRARVPKNEAGTAPSDRPRRGEKKAVNYLYADGHIKNLLTLEGAVRRPDAP